MIMNGLRKSRSIYFQGLILLLLSFVGLMSGPVLASSPGEHAEPDESRYQQQSLALN